MARRGDASRTAKRNVALVVLAAAMLSQSDTAAAALDAFYAHHRELISHRMFEACVAVASFATAGFFFSALEAAGMPKLMTRLAPTDTARTDTDDAAGSTEVVVGTTCGGDRVSFLVGQSTADGASLHSFLPSSRAFGFWLTVNIVVYLGLIDASQRLLGDSIAVLHFTDDAAPSFVRMLMEVAFSVWAYDFLFYFIHRSWHRALTAQPKAWWARVHLLHHDNYEDPAQPLHPMSTFHHHFVDAAGQVMINIIVQQIPLPFFPGPRHRLSKALHNIVVTYLLVEAHSGFDLPFMSHRLFPTIFGGSVRHQIHHQQGSLFFHQFFKYLDGW